MKLIKIPILVCDNKYYKLNLPNPPEDEETQVFIYLNAMMILGVGPYFDEGEVDYDFTLLMLTNGSSFKLPMPISESMKYLGFEQITD